MRHQNISVTGSLNLNGVGVATTANLNAFTASSDTKVDALIVKTGSYATTGSNTFTDAQIVQGTLTAQTLVVQTVTSSVLYTTGSNIIGSSLSNVQQITGSLGVTGSTTLNGALSGSSANFSGNVGIGTINAIANLTLKENESYKALVLFGRTSDNLARIDFYRADETTFTGRIQIDNGTASNLSIRAQGALQFQTGGSTNRFVIDSSGSATFTSTSAGLGSYQLVVTDGSKSIKFGANTTGAEIQSIGSIPLYINYSGNNTLLNTTGGNVGIGTASPNSFLDIQGVNAKPSGASTSYWHSAIIDTTSATTGVGGGLQFMGYKTGTSAFAFFGAIAGIKENSTAGNEQGALVLYSSVSAASGLTEKMRIGSDGTKYFGAYAGSRFQMNGAGENFYQYTNGYYIWGLYNDANSVSMESAFAGNIIFRTAAQGTSSSPQTTTERMRITSSGLVTIYGTNAQERFRLQDTDNPSYTSFSEQEIRMWRPNDSGAYFSLATQAISGTWTGGGGAIDFRPLNTLRMTISATGNIGAPSGTNIYNASDIRLKQNISTISYGLDAISALNPVKYNWIDGFEPSEDGKDLLGFVAQEVLEVIPEAVESFGGDVNLGNLVVTDPLRVNEKFIIPVLVKAIQELTAKVTALEAR